MKPAARHPMAQARHLLVPRILFVSIVLVNSCAQNAFYQVCSHRGGTQASSERNGVGRFK